MLDGAIEGEEDFVEAEGLGLARMRGGALVALLPALCPGLPGGARVNGRGGRR